MRADIGSRPAVTQSHHAVLTRSLFRVDTDRMLALTRSVQGGCVMAAINVRKGMPSVQIDKAEFTRRFLARFYDPDYERLKPELDKIIETAWVTYNDYHKSPRTRKAGAGF